MKCWKILVLILVIVALGGGCEIQKTKKIKVHVDFIGPVLLAAIYNPSGGSDGTVTLQFSEDVEFYSDLAGTDFYLPIASDSLGTNPTFTAGSNGYDIIITLGTSAVITASGSFNPRWTVAGDPSAIEILATGLLKIVDIKKKNACQATPLGPVDIAD